MTGNRLPTPDARTVLETIVSLLVRGADLLMIVTRTEELDAQFRNKTYEGLLTLGLPDTQPFRFHGIGKDEDGVLMVSADGLPCIEFRLDAKYGPSFPVETTDDGMPMTRLAGSLVLLHDVAAKRYYGSFFTGDVRYPEVMLAGTRATSSDGVKWITLSATLGNGTHSPLPAFDGRILGVQEVVHVVTSSLERTPSPYNW